MMLLRYHYIYELELSIFIIWIVIIWPAASRVFYPESQKSANVTFGQDFGTNSQDHAGATLHNGRFMSSINTLEPRFVSRIQRRKGKPAVRSNSEDPSVSTRGRSQMLHIFSKVDESSYKPAEISGVGDGAHKIQPRDNNGRKHDRDDADDAVDEDNERDTKKIKIEDDGSEDPVYEDDEIELEDELDEGFMDGGQHIGDYCKHRTELPEDSDLTEWHRKGEWQNHLQDFACNTGADSQFDQARDYLKLAEYPAFYHIALEKGIVWTLALPMSVNLKYPALDGSRPMTKKLKERYKWTWERHDYGLYLSHINQALLDLAGLHWYTPLATILNTIDTSWADHVVTSTNWKQRSIVPYFQFDIFPLGSTVSHATTQAICSPFGFHKFSDFGYIRKQSEMLILFWEVCLERFKSTRMNIKRRQPLRISYALVQVKTSGILAFVWNKLFPQYALQDFLFIVIRRPNKLRMGTPDNSRFWDEYFAFRALMSTEEAISVTEMLVETRNNTGLKEISSFTFGFDQFSQQWQMVIMMDDVVDYF